MNQSASGMATGLVTVMPLLWSSKRHDVLVEPTRRWLHDALTGLISELENCGRYVSLYKQATCIVSRVVTCERRRKM
jgi:hypothetical protein